MKKIWFFIVPVLVLALGATLAFTDQDRPSRPERKAFAKAFALASPGYRLGVVLSEINPHLRDDLKIDSGVVIDEVVSDSPAEKAGLKDGDIMLSIDGKKIDTERDVRRALKDLDEPKEVAIEILRDGKPMTVRATPDNQEINIMTQFGGNHIGVQLQELDSDLAQYFKTSPDAGILVTKVERESPAEKAGVKSGDVITGLNGTKITSEKDLRDALDNVKEGDSASISVLRHGKAQNLSIKPEHQSFHNFSMPELADMDEFRQLRNLPEIRNLPNRPEFRESMEDLRRELQELKNDMEDLRRELRERD